jgi:hypothetical protein
VALPVNRQFLIYTDVEGACTVQEDGIAAAHRFPDILAAIMFIHRQRCGDEVKIKCLDALGNVTFETMI